MDEEFNNNTYNNNNYNNNRSSSAIASMVCGICSLVFCVTFHGIISLILGIIATSLGSKERHYDKQANAGFVMGVIGICIAGAKLLAFIFVLFPLALV